MLGKKRDHIAVFMMFYYMEYVPSKYYVSFMVSTNTRRLKKVLQILGLLGSYSNYSALEAVFAALVPKYMYDTYSLHIYDTPIHHLQPASTEIHSTLIIKPMGS